MISELIRGDPFSGKTTSLPSTLFAAIGFSCDDVQNSRRTIDRYSVWKTQFTIVVPIDISPGGTMDMPSTISLASTTFHRIRRLANAGIDMNTMHINDVIMNTRRFDSRLIA